MSHSNTLLTLDSLPTDYTVELNGSMIISLEGEQADSYLQGQLTVNINTLDEKTVRHYAHCDNKGKTWSTGFIARYGTKILLLTNKDAGARTLAELNKYGVFSKVDIIDNSEEMHAYFVSRSAAKNLLGPLFSNSPFVNDESPEPLISHQAKEGLCFETDTKQPGYVVILNASASKKLRENIAELAMASYSHTVYDAIKISNAHAQISGDTVGEYVPQMLNLHALNAIDFDKGCYMGQEVVARTRFLGKNKRAAYAFHIAESVELSAGATVEKQLGENWRRAGQIISVAKLEGETWFMAVLSNETTEEDLHRLADHSAITCYPCPLPYSIEQQASNIVKKRR